MDTLSHRMEAKIRIVTHLPLRELWRDNGFISNSRGRSLTKNDITEFLRAGLVQFVVADVGTPFEWIQLQGCHQFWKDEVKPHLAANSRAVLDGLPGGYCYFACQWDTEVEEIPIVVLEKHH
jgi:hypothetical protein